MFFKHTFFNTPILKHFLKFVAFSFLKISGWKTEGEIPKNLKKYVMIAAPHTSNYDLPMMLVSAFSFNIKIYWTGKRSIFKFPFQTIMMWMGGIPIDRDKTKNVVSKTVDLFNEHDELIVIIPPEGTRGEAKYWKTGFYHIANEAGIPIVSTYLDYKRKIAGIGPILTPTGDVEKDMKIIREFYNNVSGKYPDKFKAVEK